MVVRDVISMSVQCHMERPENEVLFVRIPVTTFYYQIISTLFFYRRVVRKKGLPCVIVS